MTGTVAAIALMMGTVTMGAPAIVEITKMMLWVRTPTTIIGIIALHVDVPTCTS